MQLARRQAVEPGDHVFRHLRHYRIPFESGIDGLERVGGTREERAVPGLLERGADIRRVEVGHHAQ